MPCTNRWLNYGNESWQWLAKSQQCNILMLIFKCYGCWSLIPSLHKSFSLASTNEQGLFSNLMGFFWLFILISSCIFKNKTTQQHLSPTQNTLFCMYCVFGFKSTAQAGNASVRGSFFYDLYKTECNSISDMLLGCAHTVGNISLLSAKLSRLQSQLFLFGADTSGKETTQDVEQLRRTQSHYLAFRPSLDTDRNFALTTMSVWQLLQFQTEMLLLQDFLLLL